VGAFGFREVKLRRLPVVFKQKTDISCNRDEGG